MNDEIKILSDYKDYKDNTKVTPKGEGVVWAGVIDCRYAIEVQRTTPYNGLYIIYDLDDNKVIYTENVSVSYDAKFGPDINDVNVWQEKACGVVDSLIDNE